MKKLMVTLLFGCLILVLSGSIFACDKCAEGQVSLQQSLIVDTDLWATVHPYAKVCITHADNLFFSGAGNFQSDAGDLKYNIETNYIVNVTGKGTAFKLLGFELVTKYSSKFGFFPTQYADPGETLNLGMYPFGKWDGNTVHYSAKTGKDITSQPAGHYKAVYAITVSAPLWNDATDNW